MLGWLDGPQPKTDNIRIVYENDESRKAQNGSPERQGQEGG